MKERKTIKRSELVRLAFCNSDKLPRAVNVGGRLKRWVGIGWVDEGPAQKFAVDVVED